MPHRRAGGQVEAGQSRNTTYGRSRAPEIDYPGRMRNITRAKRRLLTASAGGGRRTANAITSAPVTEAQTVSITVSGLLNLAAAALKVAK